MNMEQSFGHTLKEDQHFIKALLILNYQSRFDILFLMGANIYGGYYTISRTSKIEGCSR